MIVTYNSRVPSLSRSAESRARIFPDNGIVTSAMSLSSFPFRYARIVCSPDTNSSRSPEGRVRPIAMLLNTPSSGALDQLPDASFAEVSDLTTYVSFTIGSEAAGATGGGSGAIRTGTSITALFASSASIFFARRPIAGITSS